MNADHPPRPEPLDVEPGNIPSSLKDRDQWVAWRYELRDAEWTKPPVNPHTGRYARSTDPETWGAFDDALDAYNDDTDTAGVGFTLTGKYIVGIDLDDCVDPDTGDIDSWARSIVEDIPSYWEISPSGTGLRGIGLGILPDDGTRADIDGADGHIEMYNDARYLTLTGHTLDNSTDDVQEVNGEIQTTHAAYIGGNTGDDQTTVEDTDGTHSEPVGVDDTELIDRARNAKNGEKFRRLFDHGDISGYPSQSEADQALMDLLAFWTGKDKRRMIRLFRKSALGKRDKADRDDYVGGTAEEAIDYVGDVYRPDGGRDPSDGGRDPSDTAEHRIDAALDAPERDESLPGPQTVAAQAGVEGPKAFKSMNNGQISHYAWKVLRPHLDLLVALPDETLFGYGDGVWSDEHGKQTLREAGKNALGPHYSRGVLGELKEQVATSDGIRRDELGVEPGTIAVGNGLLDLETRDLRPLEPEDYALSRLPVDYDPDAGCPRWIEFLKDSVNEQDLRKLQEYAGYTLLHWAQPFKKALLLIGPTDSGKSTFLKTIRSLLGTDNVASESLSSLTGTRWGTARLYGQYANIRNELTPQEVENPQRFKELTGGEDMIDAEFKGKDKFEFVVTQKFLFATNQVPDIEYRDDAFNNRWLFADFPHTVPTHRQDPDLYEKLVDELPGILNWMLEGYDRLMDQGRFSGERPIADKESLWQEHGGPLDRFKHQHLEITGNPDHAEVKSEVHEVYVDHCTSMGVDAITQSKLTQKLKTDPKIGTGQRDLDGYDTSPRVYTGVRFVDPNLRATGDGEESQDGRQESIV